MTSTNGPAGRVAGRVGDRRLVFVAVNPAIDRLLEVDTLEPGAIHRPVGIVALPGGKSFNAARAAHLLGVEVIVVAFLAGHAGAWIAETATREGMLVDPVWSDGETRTCTSILDRSTGRLTEIYEEGHQVPAEDWLTLERRLDQALEAGQVDGIVCSGSLPARASIEVYGRMVEIGRDRGVPVAVDASGLALRAALEARPALVKMNRGEAALTAGMPVATDRDVIKFARWCIDRGAEKAVVTLGPDGAIGVERSSDVVIRLDPVPDLGRYPVGSGDAFLAGLVLGLMDEAFGPALALATAAAVSNAQLPGAGRFDHDALEGYRRRVRFRLLQPTST